MPIIVGIRTFKKASLQPPILIGEHPITSQQIMNETLAAIRHSLRLLLLIFIRLLDETRNRLIQELQFVLPLRMLK
ncbi:hypothetical protein D3C86_1928710 [compost metagenome]